VVHQPPRGRSIFSVSLVGRSDGRSVEWSTIHQHSEAISKGKMASGDSGAVLDFDVGAALGFDVPEQSWAPKKMQFWTLDPVEGAEDGAVVLLIHGLGCAGQAPESAGFDQLQTRQLCRFGRVVAPDLFGHGGSVCPRGEEHYTMAQQARAVVSLLDHLHAKHVFIFGHSMGGPIALAVAEACSAEGSPKDLSVRCILYSEPNVDGGDCFGSRQGTKPGLDLSAGSAAWQDTPSSAANAASCRDLVRESDAGGLPGRMLALHQQGTPSLVLVGSQNQGKLTSTSALLEAEFSVEFIEHAGHSQHIDNPEAFYAAAVKFMATHQAHMVAAIPSLTLTNGASMPQMAWGSGTTWFEGSASESADAEAEAEADSQLHRCIHAALETGFRHLDCAEMYGTEIKVGQALSSWMRRSGTPRTGVFVTSKVWRSCNDVEAACRASLAKLGLRQLDLYLLHTPVSFMDWVPASERDAVQRAVWAGMEGLVDAGLTRAIGVSNFSTEELSNLLSYAKIKPAVNQVEHHPYCQPGTGRENHIDLRDLCREHAIVLEAYSPLAPLTRGAGMPLDGVIEGIASSRDDTFSAAEMLLRWGIEHGAAVVTTSTRPARIAQAPLAFRERCQLTAEEMRAMDGAGGAVRRQRGYWAEQFGDCYS
jgi:diketogulonate reductase-like aldo/keto reductase/pimeloyl-ACP methyl ester carboxylesterase